jgi:hypothetical protein
MWFLIDLLVVDLLVFSVCHARVRRISFQDRRKAIHGGWRLAILARSLLSRDSAYPVLRFAGVE